MIHEKILRRAIVERYNAKLLSRLELDVAIWGAGPSGLPTVCLHAKAGKKVAELVAQ
jgi:ribulose 1,5-bisphosphate synthetase/thiazole synthase